MSTAVLDTFLNDLPAADALEVDKHFRFDWSQWARPKQREPEGDWDVLGFVAGRGGGKTRPGAEITRKRAEDNPGIRIALVGRTAPDTRDTMVLGESGLIAVAPPWCRPVYKPSRRLVLWPNGSEAHLYSAAEPDLLRGPQHHFAWGDEFAAWQDPMAWSNLQDGLRLGQKPQVVLTTTPRRTDLVADTFLGPWRTDPSGKKVCRYVSKEQAKSNSWEFYLQGPNGELIHRTVVRRWSTEENAMNLSPGYAAKRRAKYGDTALGRQELDAEIADKVEGALWTLETIDNTRVTHTPKLKRIEIAVDPTRADDPVDECGIIVGGLGENGECYILADLTVKGSPLTWARAAVSAYNRYSAAAIIYEENRLGEDIQHTIHTVAPGTKWVPVTASTEKAVRAAGPSALYEQGKVHHVRTEAEEKAGENPLAILEEEMCVWDPQEPKLSPNRLDALVWLVTSLMIGIRPTIAAPRSVGTRPSHWRT